MSAGNSFKSAWMQVSADRALLPNSVDSYWSWTKLFFKFTGKGAALWTGRDWERFERWMIAEGYSYSARRQSQARGYEIAPGKGPKAESALDILQEGKS